METGFDYRRIINYASVANNIIIYPEQSSFDIYNVFVQDIKCIIKYILIKE